MVIFCVLVPSSAVQNCKSPPLVPDVNEVICAKLCPPVDICLKYNEAPVLASGEVICIILSTSNFSAGATIPIPTLLFVLLTYKVVPTSKS